MFLLDSIIFSVVVLILVAWCTFFAVGISIAGIIYIVNYIINLIDNTLNKNK